MSADVKYVGRCPRMCVRMLCNVQMPYAYGRVRRVTSFMHESEQHPSPPSRANVAGQKGHPLDLGGAVFWEALRLDWQPPLL